MVFAKRIGRNLQSPITSSNRFKEGLRWAFYEKSKVALNHFLTYYLLKRPLHCAWDSVRAVRNFSFVLGWCQKFRNSF